MNDAHQPKSMGEVQVAFGLNHEQMKVLANYTEYVYGQGFKHGKEVGKNFGIKFPLSPESRARIRKFLGFD